MIPVTPKQAPAPPSPDGLGSPLAAWKRFFFQPTDPSTLGFMRVITGVIVFYVMFAYCFDLVGFFGKDAWWDRDTANIERKGQCYIAFPLGWEDYVPSVRTSEIPFNRSVIIDFLRQLPETDAGRKERLRYFLDDLPNDAGAVKQGLDFVHRLVRITALPGDAAMGRDAVIEAKRRIILALLNSADASHAGVVVPDRQEAAVPPFIMAFPAAQREQLSHDLVNMLIAIPAADIERGIILDFLAETAPDRGRFRAFLTNLPSVRAETDAILDHMDRWGFDKRQLYAQGREVYSAWFHVSDPRVMWTVHLLGMCVVVLFTVGFQSRLTAALTWFLILNYVHRSNQVLFGMDTMMNILMAYLTIGNSGGAFSVDRLLARRRAARAIEAANGKPVPWADVVLAGPLPSWTANFAIRMFQIHFCFIYMSSGLSKLKGTTWWDWTAGWETIANPDFTPIYMSYYEWALRGFAELRLPFQMQLGFVSVFTLVLEIGLPILVWTRLRPAVVIGGIFLHGGIAIIMGLTNFSMLMMALLVCYIPAEVIRRRFGTVGQSGSRMSLSYSPLNAAHRRLARMFRTLDIARQVDFKPNEALTEATLHVEGKSIAEADIAKDGFDYLAFAKSWAWLLWLPGAKALTRRFAASGKGQMASPHAVAKPSPKAVA